MAEHNVTTLTELDDASWALLLGTLRRFEQSWQEAANPDLAQFLPPPDAPLREPILAELIKVDQDYRWRGGQRQMLETYLAQWPELKQRPGIVKELLDAECLTRTLTDESPTPEELQSRFPQIHSDIDLSAIQGQAESERRPPGRLAAASLSTSDEYRETPSQTGSEPVASPPLVCGQRFGRYEIRGVAGKGAMGMVYRAYDTRLDREVALKIQQFDLSADDEVVQRFVREAQAAATTRHPNICPIHDVDHVEGSYYIAMALIEGRSLAAIRSTTHKPAPPCDPSPEPSVRWMFWLGHPTAKLWQGPTVTETSTSGKLELALS